jgi:hypothetical protein
MAGGVKGEKAKVKPASVPDRLVGVLAALNGLWSQAEVENEKYEQSEIKY